MTTHSNRTLSEDEFIKIFSLYANYQEPRNTRGFIQMIWEEAYDLGRIDAGKEGYVTGYNEGVKWERNRAK